MAEKPRRDSTENAGQVHEQSRQRRARMNEVLLAQLAEIGMAASDSEEYEEGGHEWRFMRGAVWFIPVFVLVLCSLWLFVGVMSSFPGTTM